MGIIENIIKKNIALFGPKKGPEEAEKEIIVELTKRTDDFFYDQILFNSPEQLVEWITTDE